MDGQNRQFLGARPRPVSSTSRRPTLDVFADEAVREDPDVQRRLRGILDDGAAVFLRQREHPEDLADAMRAPWAWRWRQRTPMDGPAVVARPSRASVVGGVRAG
jgi:hypothetical protein